MAHLSNHPQNEADSSSFSRSASFSPIRTIDSELDESLVGELSSVKKHHHHHHLPNPKTNAPLSPVSSDETDFDDKQMPSKNLRGSGDGGVAAEEKSAEKSKRNGDVEALGDGARIPVELEKVEGGNQGRYMLKIDPDLRRLLARSDSFKTKKGKAKRKAKFSDLVFTKRFTTFDRQNSESSHSPFYGFFTLFWLGIFIFMLKVFAVSYRDSGRIFGPDIVSIMFQPNNLIDCLFTDAVMFYGSSLWNVPLQQAIYRGYISWGQTGWILQTVWQGFYIGVVIGYTLYKDWPWIQTVFIVLHCLAMLMKQHSYAFYNGYLSDVYHGRELFQDKLQQMRMDDQQHTTCLDGNSNDNNKNGNGKDYTSASSTTTAAATPATAAVDKFSELRKRHHTRRGSADSGVDLGEMLNGNEDLDCRQVAEFERILASEIDFCNAELQSKVAGGTGMEYPQNLTWWNFFEYIHFPTVVYELEYPRNTSINWNYVVEKATATFGVLLIMVVVSQQYIYPVVMRCNEMKNWPIEDRLREFPWILLDLVFPFMIEYLMNWYLIWELILNLLGELTLFADRGFYGDWWNSTTWDAFARDWNKPVHNFLLRHVYHSSISAYHVSRQTATLITFFLSACVHELVMWAVFKKLRGYLLCAQMLQLPLVMLSRTRLLKGRKIVGNIMFWLGIYTGPSFLCSLYLII